MKAGTRKLSEDHKARIAEDKDIWRKRNDVSACARALWCALRNYETTTNYETYPCQDRLAKDLKTTTRSIRTWTKELLSCGLVETRMTRMENGNKKLLYTCVAPCPSNDTGKTQETPPEKIVPFPTPNCTGSTPSTIPNYRAESTSKRVSHV